MLDKLWEFFTSDDKVVRLLSFAALFGVLILVYAAVYYLNTAMLISLAVAAAGGVIAAIVVGRSQKKARKADEEYRRLLEEEDDGVTGYIAVRPEELEGAPWEVRKPKPKPADKNSQE
jgi:energy-converting hydrogenase Eha subunit C